MGIGRTSPPRHPVAAMAALLVLGVLSSPPPVVAGSPQTAGGVRAAAPSILVTAPATGAAAIPAGRARVGGSGAWTDLHGLVLTEQYVTDLATNDRIDLELPIGFEWNIHVTAAPSVTGCELRSSSVSYPSEGVASIRMILGMGGPGGDPCRIAYQVLQVRPVSATMLARGGPIHIRIREATPPSATLVGPTAGTVGMVVTSPTWPSIVPATGGDAIPPSTAATGGTGAWTTLTGPVIEETADLQLLVGMTVILLLPPGFEWNRAIDLHPQVTGCDRALGGNRYQEGSRPVLFDVIDAPGWPATYGRCRIDFGSVLLLRPVDASGPAATSGQLTVVVLVPGATAPLTLPGGGGTIALATPPPAVSLSLAANAPTMVNGAILWGEGVDLVTTAPVGTAFTLQVTTDNETWTTLADATGTALAFTIGADGSSTYRYRPVRNYWYRAVAGTSVSNTPRVTVRQTIVIRPIHDGTRRVAAGTSVTFNATVRPAGPALPTASVRFELYRRSGSRWILSQSVAVAADPAGVASTTFTFARGSWYVRAQAQPTRVNANSLWTPSQHYTAP